MKKRILALALAGTTAFSVFGSALSANATLSTDTVYEVDAYMSYDLIATQIDAEYTAATEAVPTIGYMDKSTGKAFTDTNGNYLSKDKIITDVLSTYTQIAGNYNATEYIRINVSASGSNNEYFYIDPNATEDELFDIASGKVYDGNKNADDLNGYVTVTTLGDNEKTYSLTKDPTKSARSLKGLIEQIKVADDTWHIHKTLKDSGGKIFVFEKDVTDADGKNFDVYTSKYVDAETYFNVNATPVKISDGTATDADGEVTVRYKGEGNMSMNYEPYDTWNFNSDLTGEVEVTPYKVTTSFGSDGKLDVVKTRVPTIYAYDFLYTNNTKGSAKSISNAWNAHDEVATADAIVTPTATENHLIVETGRGKIGVGIRYDVVTEWEDFMEELAISDKWGYSEGFEDFCDNYEDMFYSDPVFDRWTGELVGNVDVDLYNIRGLLWDIWNLHESDDYEQANTSQLIYLMQQYDKYIGNYIDKAEVASDEWGDLLLSILDAATEEDFRSASEYRKYQNEVEDLRDAYELATTVNMIRAAEEKMYDLLTDRNTQYRVSTAADKADLNSTLGGLYFNVGSAPTEYSVMPSTLSSNVTYSNYNYYVAALKISDSWVGLWTDNLYFTNTFSRGYYSLYPMADYEQAGNSNEVYPGNTVSTDAVNANAKGNYYENGSSTDEYQWFWNVYQLAANMNDDNNKQGSIDAVNDALSAAVADLTVTTTPNSTEVGAVEDALEEYAGKIDTDYNEGYYAKYTQANDYAENIAEGKWQTRIAAMITGVAGEALTYQGTQVTVTKNDMKTVETAIKNGETALEAIKADPDYNAAQVTALNKAIDNAQYLVDLYEGTYSTKKDDQSVNKNYSRLVGDKDQMVKSDLTAAIEAIDAAINYSEIVMGWSQNDAGKWMYGTEEGYLNDGWHQVDGGKTWFYFNADGTAKQSEWWNDNGTWYWFNSNCGAATGWAKVDGEWYFFKGNNAMKTGWEKVDGNWYYMASSGKMVTGWCEVNGKWYYFSKESNSLGQMLYSTTVDGYKLGADGAWIK